MVNAIGVIGRTAQNANLYDGQTVKTRVLVDELRIKYPDAQIYIVDTYNYKKRALVILKDLFYCIRKSQIVFVLLSRNGRKLFFPIIFFINRFYKRPIIHDTIGGAHAKFLAEDTKLMAYYKKFDVNWVESKGLQDALLDMGLDNVAYLPNFKRLNCVSEDEVVPYGGDIFKFCTFSRVNESKGIGRAAEAIMSVNKKNKRTIAVLDVYGPIEDKFEDKLSIYSERSNGAVSYKGTVPADKSVDVLKNYYALLFPTTFTGEGFPGTIIDAMSSAIPIIATDWHLNPEIITHGYTGFLYSSDEPEQLEYWIEYAINHPEEIYKMKFNCLEEVRKYKPEAVMDVIDKKLQELIV